MLDKIQVSIRVDQSALDSLLSWYLVLVVNDSFEAL